jgi:lipopolysaccharide/colanic/teichoic acid biosynthesis glycosyltransferase
MQAVILATADPAALAPLHEGHPLALLPLVDRPLIQHVVEYLAGQGVHRFDWILSHHPERIEALLGDGSRWGCRFFFHLTRQPERPYRVLPALAAEHPGAQVLLGDLRQFPCLSLRDARSKAEACPRVLFFQPGPSSPGKTERPVWNRWALVSASVLRRLPPDVTEEELTAYLPSGPVEEQCWIAVDRCLSLQSCAELLAAQRAILTQPFPGLLRAGREIQPGIWCAPHVHRHPTAQLQAPCYIGEDTVVGPGVRLGPNAIISEHCVLDRACTVSQGIILPGSYVGEGVEVTNAIVDRNQLIKADGGATIHVAEDFILGSLANPAPVQWLKTLLTRLAALLLLGVTAPILLGAILYFNCMRRGPVWHRREIVRRADSGDEQTWQTFALWSLAPIQNGNPSLGQTRSDRLRNLVLHFLPALASVVRGEISFVGLPPRTRHELHRLPQDWQALYRHTKVGMITEAAVHAEPTTSDAELYTLEAFYARASGWSRDAQLLLRYLLGCGVRTRPAATPVDGDSVALPLVSARPTASTEENPSEADQGFAARRRRQATVR